VGTATSPADVPLALKRRDLGRSRFIQKGSSVKGKLGRKRTDEAKCAYPAGRKNCWPEGPAHSQKKRVKNAY